MASYISESPKEVERMIEREFLPQAEDLVRRNWPQVRALARELLGRKTLTAREIRSVIRPGR
jgi:hypothetical protein